MDLPAYLRRLGWTGPTRPELPTLAGLMRAHLAAFPFENLDVALGRPVSVSPEAAFEKLVVGRRGGWCYEQNGLFGAALEALGFAVTRLSAGVNRVQRGAEAMGNHLCLLVALDRQYLVDVGFGGSLAAPLALEPGTRDDAPFRVGLGRVEDGAWRFTEGLHGSDFSFDFFPVPADEGLLASRSHEQATSPSSGFVQNVVVQQRQGQAHLSLRGRVLSVATAAEVERTTVPTAEAWLDLVQARFGLDLPGAKSLWPAIEARHRQLGLPG